MNRRVLIAFCAIGALVLSFMGLSGCSSKDGATPLVWVWYPNESTPEREASRQAIIELVSKAIDRPIVQQLTTDYAIGIESMVNGNAAISWLGAQAYVVASNREPKIQAVAVHTEESASLDDAKYYAMLAVNSENYEEFKENGEVSLNRLKGRRFSFVSNSSTSGFVVPSSIISNHFGVSADDLLEGGRDKVFSDVLFGGSHQGAFLNVLQNRADVAAYCNTCVAHYIDFVKGEFSDPKPGDIVRVRQGATAPFDRFEGRENRLIATVPVLNECVAVNGNLLTEDEIAKIREALTSDEAANNPLIFGDRKDPQNPSFFQRGQRFVPVEDSWYNPVRSMTGISLR